MLFIAHSAAAGINAGKVYFTQNPVSINYPQWLAFAKYSYSQLKWTLINKPKAREAYINNKLDEELTVILSEVNESFKKLSEDNIIVMG